MIAYCARYGNQQIDTLLGRTPSVREIQLFMEELTEIVGKEPYIRLG